MAGTGELRRIRGSVFVCCIAGSIGAHALVVSVAAAMAPTRIVATSAYSSPPLETRLIAHSAPVVATPAPSESALTPPMAQSPVAAVLPPQPVQVHLPLPLPATETEPTQQAQTEPAIQAFASNMGDDYLPRELLTQAPTVNTMVIVPYPPDLPEGQRYSLTLLLYVDEFGVVRRVRTERQAPFETMDVAAHQAFLQARFRPGEIDGRAVKSRIQVEVTFDSTPLDVTP